MTTINTDINTLAKVIAEMSRDQVVDEICHFQGRFKLDFSSEFLQSQTEDRLKHILFAALVQLQRNDN